MGTEFSSALCDGTAIPAAEPVRTVQDPGCGVEETCLQTCILIIMFSCSFIGRVCFLVYISSSSLSQHVRQVVSLIYRDCLDNSPEYVLSVGYPIFKRFQIFRVTQTGDDTIMIEIIRFGAGTLHGTKGTHGPMYTGERNQGGDSQSGRRARAKTGSQISSFSLDV